MQIFNYEQILEHYSEDYITDVDFSVLTFGGSFHLNYSVRATTIAFWETHKALSEQ